MQLFRFAIIADIPRQTMSHVVIVCIRSFESGQIKAAQVELNEDYDVCVGRRGDLVDIPIKGVV